VPEEIFKGFTLKSLREYSHQNLLSSNVPEEIILTILTDFEGNKAEDVLRNILHKLQAIGGQEITLRKYIRQLAMLARLRNLVQETQKQVKDMGLTYNITEDPLYQEGLLKGEEKGIEKGQKAREKSLIIDMLKDGTLTVEKIATLAKVSVEYVKQVAGEMGK
jgi:predicted transposase YdaD